MEWVIALLGVGCVFFAAQVVVDFIKYRKAIEPKMERLKEAKAELQSKIATTEAELEKTRSDLEPSKADVDRLEKEYDEVQREVDEEAAKQQRHGQS